MIHISIRCLVQCAVVYVLIAVLFRVAVVIVWWRFGKVVSSLGTSTNLLYSRPKYSCQGWLGLLPSMGC